MRGRFGLEGPSVWLSATKGLVVDGEGSGCCHAGTMPTSVSASNQDAVEERSGLRAGQRGVAAGSTSIESHGAAASTEGEPSWV